MSSQDRQRRWQHSSVLIVWLSSTTRCRTEAVPPPLVLGCVLGYEAGECYDIAEGEQQMVGRYPEIVYTDIILPGGVLV